MGVCFFCAPEDGHMARYNRNVLLAARMALLDISGEELAELSHTTPATISRILNGRYRFAPHDQTILTLAVVLDCTPAEIGFTLTDEGGQS